MDVLYKGILPLELEVYRKVRQDALTALRAKRGGSPSLSNFSLPFTCLRAVLGSYCLNYQ